MKQMLGRSEGLEPEFRLVQVRALTTSKAMASQVSGLATRASVKLSLGISSPDQSPAPLLNAYTPHVDLRIFPLETFLD